MEFKVKQFDHENIKAIVLPIKIESHRKVVTQKENTITIPISYQDGVPFSSVEKAKEYIEELSKFNMLGLLVEAA